MALPAATLLGEGQGKITVNLCLNLCLYRYRRVILGLIVLGGGFNVSVDGLFM